MVVIVVLVVVGVLMSLGRRRRREAAELQANEDREHAGRLREDAKDADLNARAKNAAAARTAADAEEAAVEAERLKIDAERQRAAAANDDARSKEKLAQAIALDPDVQTPERTGPHPEAHGNGDSFGEAEPKTSIEHDDIHDPRDVEESGPGTDGPAVTSEENLHGRRRETL